MLTIALLVVDSYLLLGAVFMLIINELLEGSVTQREFLKGMLLWLPMLGVFLWAFVRGVWERYRA